MPSSLWTDDGATDALDRWARTHGEDVALRIYTTRLYGADPTLVRHGGGNTSVKTRATEAGGREIPVLRIKASGRDFADLEPEDLVALDLDRLAAPLRERTLPEQRDGDRDLEIFLRSRMLDPTAAAPSLETPVHALLPGRYVDHAHPDDLLALGQRPAGTELLREALGDDVPLLPYVSPGIPLALACREALASAPGATAFVWLQHGVVTWGDDARQTYESLLEVVERCRATRRRLARSGLALPVPREIGEPEQVLRKLRGLLSPRRFDPLANGAATGPDGKDGRILRWRRSESILGQLEVEDASSTLTGPPLTADHIVRTGPWPVWLDPERQRDWPDAVRDWSRRYLGILGPEADATRDHLPRTALVPGLGLVAVARTAAEADIALDLLEPSIAVQHEIAASGADSVHVAEEHLAEMDRRPWQTAKRKKSAGSLHGRIALVTGAAGAIGSGVVEILADAGAHVAVADLPGPALDDVTAELERRAPSRVLPLPFDVTDGDATARAFDLLTREWGGLDLLVLNAGLAHVASLEDLDPADFRRLQAVNTEGVLHGLRTAARTFRHQGVGGDVILISTKNVFSPGASFGAYSASKAAAHQLARIASQELAALGVRVNMVSPDAVFGGPERPSGLWKEVGPSRMRARGLAPEELEDYYRRRNLLEARVQPRHVGRAVLFFAERHTPTTGATLPVDGGLPDATPR